MFRAESLARFGEVGAFLARRWPSEAQETGARRRFLRAPAPAETHARISHSHDRAGGWSPGREPGRGRTSPRGLPSLPSCDANNYGDSPLVRRAGIPERRGRRAPHADNRERLSAPKTRSYETGTSASRRGHPPWPGPGSATERNPCAGGTRQGGAKREERRECCLVAIRFPESSGRTTTSLRVWFSLELVGALLEGNAIDTAGEQRAPAIAKKTPARLRRAGVSFLRPQATGIRRQAEASGAEASSAKASGRGVSDFIPNRALPRRFSPL